MVDVKWDFQGGVVDLRAAEQSVGKLLTFYKDALAGVTCPVHERTPWLKVKGRTVRDLLVTVEACCEESLHRATSRVDGVSRRHQV